VRGGAERGSRWLVGAVLAGTAVLAILPLVGPGPPAGSWPLTLAVLAGLCLLAAERRLLGGYAYGVLLTVGNAGLVLVLALGRPPILALDRLRRRAAFEVVPG
jgi:hypothetical protein